MATELTGQKIGNLGIYGLVRPAAVDDDLIPDGAVTDVQNFHFDRRGASTVRPGLVTLGGTVTTTNGSFLGFHSAQGGTPIVVMGTTTSATIYSFNGSAWSVSLTSVGTAGVRPQFVDFGSYTIAINHVYNTYSSMRFWNAGSSRHWHFTGNPINPQNLWGLVPQVGEVFKNRVYVSEGLATRSSRLLFSSVISSAGNITWSPTVDFVDINPGDGEYISALKRYATELLVFKPNYIYRFRSTSTDPDPLIRIGTRVPESVIEGIRGLYFYHHKTGFYRYDGGYPVKISSSIEDFVNGIAGGAVENYGNAMAWKDNDHIYWSIAAGSGFDMSITEDGLAETYSNIVLRYTESSDVWTVFTYAFPLASGIQYTRDNTATTSFAVARWSGGVVATPNSGTTDLGEPIQFRLRTKWESFGSIAFSKVINEIAAVCEKAQGVEIYYQIDEETSTWRSIGQLKKMVSFFDNLDIRFHRIRFRVAGITRIESTVFRSIEITRGINEGLVKEK